MFPIWRQIGNGVLQTLEIQSLPNPEGCLGISPCFADIYRCKATENFNFFLQKILKCFGIGFHPIEYEMNTTRRWSPLFGSPNMEEILQ